MVRFSFSGQDLMALPQGALFWPARRALLVADLHLEKASWFARLGQMLPPYDSIATLTELGAIVEATGASEIWCLGDSFHDRHGCDRLPSQARERLLALTAATRWTWITGNHDPGFADHCGGEIVKRPKSRGCCSATKPIRPRRGPNCPATSIPSCGSPSAGGIFRAAASSRPSAS